MPRLAPSPWEVFRSSRNPIAKIRELKNAVPDGPGLSALYREAKERGTILGVPVLTVGKNIYLPRQLMIDRIEGRAQNREEQNAD